MYDLSKGIMYDLSKGYHVCMMLCTLSLGMSICMICKIC